MLGVESSQIPFVMSQTTVMNSSAETISSSRGLYVPSKQNDFADILTQSNMAPKPTTVTTAMNTTTRIKESDVQSRREDKIQLMKSQLQISPDDMISMDRLTENTFPVLAGLKLETKAHNLCAIHHHHHHQEEDSEEEDDGSETCRKQSEELQFDDAKKQLDASSLATALTSDCDSEQSTGNSTPTFPAKYASPEDAPVKLPQSNQAPGVQFLLPPREASSQLLLNEPQYSSTSTQKQKHITPYQPVLYSAIGSLEQYSQHNIGSFQKKIITATESRASSRKKKGASRQLNTNQIQIQSESKLDSPSNNHEQAHSKLNTNNRRPNQKPKGGQIQMLRSQSSSSISLTDASRHGLIKHTLTYDMQNNDPQCAPIPETKKDSKVKMLSINDTEKIRKRPVEMFRPSCDAYTPRMGKKAIEYKPTTQRTHVQKMSAPIGTLQRPNFQDALRRVSMIICQHVVKIERRFKTNEVHAHNAGLFSAKMATIFAEDNFLTPRYKCNLVRIPMARAGIVCGMRKINTECQSPSESEIYEFAHELFKSVKLSSECSIVCLIYIERLMEVAKVPLLSNTWRPIFMCGLLLASKVWQDLSSWNIEFASVYPQYSLDAINRLELIFLSMIKWDLYISSSLYAKYYFALRSLLEKRDFRHRYNVLVGASCHLGLKIERRTSLIKEEALQHLSKSM